jgi:hypothetical protein
MMTFLAGAAISSVALFWLGFIDWHRRRQAAI